VLRIGLVELGLLKHYMTYSIAGSQTNRNTDVQRRRESAHTGHFLIRQEGVATMTHKKFSREERYASAGMKARGHNKAEIARCLSRSACAVGREMKRNSFDQSDQYWAENGRTPGPGPRICTMCLRPGPGGLPSVLRLSEGLARIRRVEADRWVKVMEKTIVVPTIVAGAGDHCTLTQRRAENS
jgi:hypothetical protein